MPECSRVAMRDLLRAGMPPLLLHHLVHSGLPLTAVAPPLHYPTSSELLLAAGARAIGRDEDLKRCHDDHRRRDARSLVWPEHDTKHVTILAQEHRSRCGDAQSCLPPHVSMGVPFSLEHFCLGLPRLSTDAFMVWVHLMTSVWDDARGRTRM